MKKFLIFTLVFSLPIQSLRALKPIFGSKSLENAIKAGDYNKVKSILDKGINVNHQYGMGKTTPLHMAVVRGNTDIVKLLIEKGANVNAKKADGFQLTPLHYAAKDGQVDIAKMLLIKGADVKANDKFQWTPLHYAANMDIAKLLIDKGADINAGSAAIRFVKRIGDPRDPRAPVLEEIIKGYTPLHFAARDGRTELVKFLIEKGANIYATNSKGQTPAELTQSSEIKQMLEEEKIRRVTAKKS